MNQPIDPDVTELFADEADSELDEWTIDELDISADLGSLRSAWHDAEDPTL